MIRYPHDRTIADNTGQPDFLLLKPMKGAKQAIDKIKKMGYTIVVYTARHWSDYTKIQDWLSKYKIKVDYIVCDKLLLRWLVDDRCLQFDNNWDEIVKTIKKG